MYLVTIDSIVRSALATHGLPMHYYVRFLHYAIKGFRELQFDTLKVVQTSRLTINSHGAITTPADMVDWVRIGIPAGQWIKPMGEDDKMSRIPNYDDNGNAIPYDNVSRFLTGYYNVWEGYNQYINRDGGIFNIANGEMDNSFRVIPERSEIQIDASFPVGTNIILEYIGFGTQANTTTQVTAYAAECIENYITWKYKQNSKAFNKGDSADAEKDFANSLRILRGRMSDLNEIDIARVIRKNYGAIPKR